MAAVFVLGRWINRVPSLVRFIFAAIHFQIVCTEHTPAENSASNITDKK